MASNSGAGPQTPIIVQTQGSSETPNWRAYGKKREYGRLAATRRRRIKETILENPLQIFVYLFKIVIFLSLSGVVIAVFYFAIANPALLKGAFVGAGEWGFIQIEKAAPDFAAKMQTAYYAFLKPEEALAKTEGGSGEVKAVQEISMIKIEDVDSGGNYASYKPIEITSRLDGIGLKKDTQLEASCELDTGGKNSYVVDADFGNSKDSFKKDIPEQSSYITCNFEKGAGYSAGDLLKQIKIKIGYNAVSESYWKAYFIHSNFIADTPKPRDVIRKYDGDLGSDGSMKTTPAYKSVMSLVFKSEGQPYTEDQEKRLKLSLQNTGGVEGNLVKLNSLKLYVPPDINMVEDKRCDFEDFGEVDYSDDSAGDAGENNDGVVVYNLKKEVFDKFNVDCESEEIKNSGITSDKCLLEKQKIDVSCFFVNHDVSEEQEIPEASLFRAVADYDFGVIGRSSVNIVRDSSKDVIA